MKIVKLSVHKNNAAQKRRKAIRKDAINQMKYCVSDANISGYAVVSWTNDGQYYAAWNTNNDEYLKAHEISDYVKKTIDKEMS